MPDLTPAEIIAQQLSEPQSAAMDGRSATNRSASDLIKLKQELERDAAAAGTNDAGGSVSPWTRLRPAKVIPPGGV